jgi:hypothetical protein
MMASIVLFFLNEGAEVCGRTANGVGALRDKRSKKEEMISELNSLMEAITTKLAHP